MNRKAIVFNIMLVAVTVFILIVAWAALKEKRSLIGEPIGIKQFDLMSTYQQGETVKFYVEQSGKYAAAGAVHQAIRTDENNPCGYYLGYPVWQRGSLQCFPTSAIARQGIELDIRASMQDYLEDYPLLTLSADRFHLVMQGSYLVGQPTSSVSLPVSSSGAQQYLASHAPSLPPVVLSDNEIDEWLVSRNSQLAGIGDCMLQVEEQTNVPSLVILGVAIHESGYHLSQLATKSKNLFGMKCADYYVTDHCTLGGEPQCCKSWDKTKLDLVYEPNDPNRYRIYASWCESVADFARLISRADRYKPAMQHTDEPEEMVKKMHAGGYATDPKWSDKVITHMRIIHNEIEALQVT
jgi:flagellum-specific peptidoglycan hydrolase FlgJ